MQITHKKVKNHGNGFIALFLIGIGLLLTTAITILFHWLFSKSPKNWVWFHENGTAGPLGIAIVLSVTAIVLMTKSKKTGDNEKAYMIFWGTPWPNTIMMQAIDAWVITKVIEIKSFDITNWVFSYNVPEGKLTAKSVPITATIQITLVLADHMGREAFMAKSGEAQLKDRFIQKIMEALSSVTDKKSLSEAKQEVAIRKEVISAMIQNYQNMLVEYEADGTITKITSLPTTGFNERRHGFYDDATGYILANVTISNINNNAVETAEQEVLTSELKANANVKTAEGDKNAMIQRSIGKKAENAVEVAKQEKQLELVYATTFKIMTGEKYDPRKADHAQKYQDMIKNPELLPVFGAAMEVAGQLTGADVENGITQTIFKGLPQNLMAFGTNGGSAMMPFMATAGQQPQQNRPNHQNRRRGKNRGGQQNSGNGTGANP